MSVFSLQKKWVLLSLSMVLLTGLIFSPAAACGKYTGPVYMYERPETVALGPDGSAYITGGSLAPSFNNDGTPRYPENATYAGLFLIKMDPVTSAINYSTWFYQPSYVNGKGIVVDDRGSPRVLVESESRDYPASWRLAGDGSQRGTYITRFSPSGTAIEESYGIFSTAHRSYKPALNLIRSHDGSLYCAIETGDSFPVTKKFSDDVESEDVIMIKISPDGKNITYADRISAGVILQSMDVAPDGSAYFAGFSLRGKFNATGFQKVNRGKSNGVIAKISPNGEHLEYVTYLGGSGIDRAISIRAGPDGSAYVAGTTSSDDFPLVNPAIANRSGFHEGYAAKISPDGQHLVWSTYLGEMINDESITIVPAPDGGAWVTGGAGISMAQGSRNSLGATGNGDAFLVKISPDGKISVPPVIFGGSGMDVATSLVLDAEGNPFVVGTTQSLDFPLVNPVNDHAVPGVSMFAASFNSTDGTIRYSTFIGGPTAYTAIGPSPDLNKTDTPKKEMGTWCA